MYSINKRCLIQCLLYSSNFAENNIPRESEHLKIFFEDAVVAVAVLAPVAAGLGARPRHGPDRRLAHRPALPQGTLCSAALPPLYSSTVGSFSDQSFGTTKISL